MSLAGLFALGIQTDLQQASSPPPRGKDESLDSLAFLDVLANLWGPYGGSQPEDEAASLTEPEAKEDVDLQASLDEFQSSREAGADFAQLSEALAAPTSAQAESSGKPALGDSAEASKAEGKAESPAPQKAAAARPSQPAPPPASTAAPSGEVQNGSDPHKSASAERVLKSDNGSIVPPSADQAVTEASAQRLEASSGGIGIARPSGRHAETLQQWEAFARPFEPEGKLPPQIERILESGPERSSLDQSILRTSLKTALASQAAQPGVLRTAAQKTLAKEAQPSSAAYRSTSDTTPKAAPEPSAEDGGDSDFTRHSQAAQRSGASTASSAAASHSASPGLRFADLLQAQTDASPSGIPTAQAHAAKAMTATASGEGMQAETATVRGQEADQIFSQVVQNARLLQSQGEARFEIRLKPEFLGKIQIESRLGADQKMTTRFLVEDPEVRLLLESRLPMLAERLGESGVRMTSLEVHSMNSQSGGDLSRSAGEAAGQSRQQQQDTGRQDQSGSSRPGSQEEELQQPQHLRGAGRIYLVA